MTTELTQALTASAPLLFRREELASLLPGANAKVLNDELADLAAAGEVLCVAPDIFFYGRRSKFGTGYPQGIDVAIKVYGENAGVGWTPAGAVNRLHLSTQVVVHEALVVPYLTEIVHPPIEQTDRSNRPARAAAKLTFIETSVLEALSVPHYWEYEYRVGLKKVADLAREWKNFDPARLRTGASSEDDTTKATLEGLLALL
jgi:hypothetical protein